MLICQKPAHFLSAQMALVSPFFQMFIVFGMYNFGYHINMLHAVKYLHESPKLPLPFINLRQIRMLLLHKTLGSIKKIGSHTVHIKGIF